MVYVYKKELFAERQKLFLQLAYGTKKMYTNINLPLETLHTLRSFFHNPALFVG